MVLWGKVEGNKHCVEICRNVSVCIKATVSDESAEKVQLTPLLSHSSQWHLCQNHPSGICSLSQHATCHLKIRDNYTVLTTGYWGAFFQPWLTRFLSNQWPFELLLITHHLPDHMFTIIKAIKSRYEPEHVRCSIFCQLEPRPPVVCDRPRWWVC